MVTGGCLCGAIRFEIDADALGGGFCYCRDCQVVSGGMPGAVMVFPRGAYRLLKGDPKIHMSTSDQGVRVGRAFCPDCGTHLSAWNEHHQAIIPVRVGALDQPSAFAPSANLWTRSAQPCHRPDRGLQCFETQPEG